MTTEQILEAVHRLSSDELKRLAQEIMQVEASRREPAMSKQETELIKRINQVPSPERVSRYRELWKKGRAGKLTDEEQQERAQLSDWIEGVHVERMGYVVELARLRGASLSDTMRQLGIKHWAD